MKRVATLTTSKVARLLTCLGIMVAAFAAFASTASASGDFDHVDPTVTCRTSVNSSGTIIDRRVFVNTPEMFIYGTTTGSPASWQPVLYATDAAETVTRKIAVGPELSGSTANGFGNGTSLGLPAWTGSFTVFQPGVYKVAILYRWYSRGIVIHSEYLWAGTHYSDILQYTPDWHIAGVPYTFSATDHCYL